MLTELALLWGLAWAQAPAPAPTESVESAASADPAAVQAFLDVVRVLQSPRCVNCHPDGDVPLQRDEGVPHGMMISRRSPEVGLPCSTCHREVGLDLPGLPPANPHWQLPPRNQVFEGRTPAELCAQLKDPEQTGGRDLDALLHHVSEDSLVLWGWSPGGGRTTPPLPHAAFVARMRTWMEGGAPCPAP